MQIWKLDDYESDFTDYLKQHLILALIYYINDFY